jgi:hypothetical protein
MVCVPCIIIPAVLWLYQNYLKKYLDPVLGPILGPILKPMYAIIEPYVGKYVGGPSTEAKCPISGATGGATEACPGAKEEVEEKESPSGSATRRKTKKAE